MGNANGCENCCANADTPSELTFDGDNNKNARNKEKNKSIRQSREKNQNSKITLGRVPNSNQTVTPNQDLKLTDKQLKKLVVLQKYLKGFLQKTKYNQFLQEMQKISGMYFRREEFLFTVNRDKVHSICKGKFKEQPQTKEIRYKTKAIYKGDMQGGFRHGNGVMTWSDNAKYEGQWSFGYACGKGTFYHADGDKYSGDWYNNKCNGYGTYQNKNNASYKGYWKNDMQHGQGEETWPEGSRYEGEYVNGTKHGRGTYTWQDNSAYNGEWINNKINGIGHYKWHDGREYIGSWKDNDMHGIGVYKYADGVIYEGQYEDDKKTGYGIYKWTDGRVYEGYWFKGKQHGLGIFKDPNKKKVKYGLWENGQRINWFKQEEIQQIKNNSFYFNDHFKDEISYQIFQKQVNKNFEAPDGLLSQIEDIKKLLLMIQNKKDNLQNILDNLNNQSMQ